MGSTSTVARRFALSVLASSAAFGVTFEVAAQARFDVPRECGSELEFRQELERVLGGKFEAASPSALSIRAVPGTDEYTLRLELGGHTRELQDHDCRTLLRSAVVIVAAAARAAPEPEPEQSTPPAPVRSPPRAVILQAPAEPATRADEARQPTLYGVHLGAGLASGVVPGLGPRVLVGASVESAPFGAAISARYDPNRTAERGGRGVDVESLGARAEGRWRVVPELELGLGIDVDRVFGSGTPEVSGRASSAAWRLAPLLGLTGIPWPEAQPRLELGVSAQVALVRPRFVVEGFGDLYRVPVLGADAIVRGSWLFR
jgi:hypothetical protein